MHKFCYVYIVLAIATFAAGIATYAITANTLNRSGGDDALKKLINPDTTSMNELTSIASAFTSMWIAAVIFGVYILAHLALNMCTTKLCSQIIGAISLVILVVFNVWLGANGIIIFAYWSQLLNNVQTLDYYQLYLTNGTHVINSILITTMVTGVLGFITCLAFFAGCFGKTHRFHIL